MKYKPLHICNTILLNITTFAFAVLMVGGEIAFDNKNMVSDFLGQATQKIVNDPDAASRDLEYFKSAFTSVAQEKSNARRFAETIEAEGAVLLKNKVKDGKASLPLKEGATVSLFSTSSVNPILSGSGSGGVGGSDAVSLLDGLKSAGLAVNNDLWDWYEDNNTTFGRKNLRGNGGAGTVSSIGDANWEEISSPAKINPADAAIFVLSRTGGEGIDSTIYAKNNRANVYGNNVTFDYKDGNYLKLNDTEKDVISHLCQLRDDGVFGSVIIMMNTTNQVQLDFLDELDVDSVLWIGSFGTTGSYAIGSILAGAVNPSGKLPDTFWKKHYLNPVHANFGSLVNGSEDPEITQWKIVNGGSIGGGQSIVYQEGMYMGYRYTETHYEDSVLKDKENVGTFNYYDAVSYPFGYGLSYSNFSYSNFKIKELPPSATDHINDVTYKVRVDVTNDSEVPGKEAVQLYLQKPYTEYDIVNHIEKPSVELVGFGKTKILQPHESETITVEVKGESLASYDAYNAKTFILDSGNYYFTMAKNAHDAVNNILAKKGKTTEDGMTENGDANLVGTIVKDYGDAEVDKTTYSKSKVKGHENVEITNQFDNADLNIYDTTGTNRVTYLTRSNWAGTLKLGLNDNNERTYDQVNVTPTEQMKLDLNASYQMFPEESKGGDYPTFGSTKTKYTLAMLRAYDDGDEDPSNNKPIPYDDPMWEDLLDQITWDEMVNFLGNAGYGNQAIPSVGKPHVQDRDGGNGIIENYQYERGLAVRRNDPNKGSSPVAYPSNSIAAATYNKTLCNYYGRQWGEDCLWSGVGGLYGVGMDTHRSPYGGRNFEYYSEDPYLMGKIAGEMMNGMKTRGAYGYMKHCVLNDQETYRCGGFTWANEQTIREIYLRSFEIAIREGGAGCIMTTMNSIGVEWTGCQGFINNVLRDEFGMLGHVVTDSLGAHNGNFGRGLFYGNDLPLGNYGAGNYNAVKPDSNGNGQYGNYAWAMREACHRALYSVAQSFNINGLSISDKVVVLTPPWINTVKSLQITFGVLFGVSLLGFGATVFFDRRNVFRLKRKEDK